jgi:hypothetical protein
MQAGGIVGDGYQGDGSSPHTRHEVFEGLGLLKAVEVGIVVLVKRYEAFFNRLSFCEVSLQ